MVSKIIPVPPFDCIVFGGKGDLAERKLFPALYRRHCSGQFTDPSRIIGVARTFMDHDSYRHLVRSALETHLPQEDFDVKQVERFLARIFYQQVNVISDNGWKELKQEIAKNPAEIRAFYLAVSPDLFHDIVRQLGKYELVTEKTRIIVEKPIGHNLHSARLLNHCLADVFSENQIFRIDHYLGKETVQNLMALRFANALYEPLWNSQHIDHVQITVAESVGLEKRTSYYDRAGALRDMVQNHLLQLLCLIAMEPPAILEANAMRDEKLKILNALAPIGAHNVASTTVRGQYIAGSSSGQPVGSYLEDLERSSSNTETFVALKILINNWRWGTTPFYLRTGKRMAVRSSEVVITFKPVPHCIFQIDGSEIIANRLVIHLQPNEGMKQWLMVKDPGPGGMRLRQIPLDMSFATLFQSHNPNAYERLLIDVIRGNQTLFMRRDEVQAAWSWIDPILDGWERTRQALHNYQAGTWGPSRSIAMIERDGRTWNDVS